MFIQKKLIIFFILFLNYVLAVEYASRERIGFRIIPVNKLSIIILNDNTYNFSTSEVSEISACLGIFYSPVKFLKIGIVDRLIRHPAFNKDALMLDVIPGVPIKKIIHISDRNRFQFVFFFDDRKPVFMYRNLIKLVFGSGITRFKISPLLANEIFLKKGKKSAFLKNAIEAGIIIRKLGLSISFGPTINYNEKTDEYTTTLKTTVMFAYPLNFQNKNKKMPEEKS